MPSADDGPDSVLTKPTLTLSAASTEGAKAKAHDAMHAAAIRETGPNEV